MDDNCILCGVGEKLHLAGEREGLINHRWTLAEELQPPRRQPPQSRPPVAVISSIDSDLRRVLLAKGIITHEDFAPVLDPGSSPAGDRGAGETPSA